MAKDEQEAIKLDYGNKIHSAMTEAGQRAARVYVITLLLAVGFIVFSSGGIKVEQDFVVLGIAFTADTPVLLGFGALILAIAHLTSLGFVYEEKLRHTELLENYASLDFKPRRDPLDPSWSALRYPDGLSAVISALQRGIFGPLAIKPLLALLKERKPPTKKPWGLLLRIVVFGVTVIFAMLILLFLPFVAEIWALIRTAQMMNGISFWFVVAVVVLIVVDTANVLVLRNAAGESMVEAGQAVGAVVLPLVQDFDKQDTETTTDEEGPDEDERRSA